MKKSKQDKEHTGITGALRGYSKVLWANEVTINHIHGMLMLFDKAYKVKYWQL